MRIATLAFVVAVAVALTSIVLVVPPISYKWGFETILLIWTVVAAVAFGLSLVGLHFLDPDRRVGVFAAATLLLGLSLAAMAFSEGYWQNKPTCSGGEVGPCMEPFLLWEGSYFLQVVAAILVGIGVNELGRVQQSVSDSRLKT